MDPADLADIITFNQTLITLLIALHTQQQLERIRVRRRRLWVRPIFMQRRQQGDFLNLFQNLKRDPPKFFEYIRMDLETFEELSVMLRPHLARDHWRAISADERLVITLRFLATGDSYGSVGFAFRVAKNTVGDIIKDTCNTLWNILQPQYLPPCCAEDFRRIAEEFWRMHGMPNCIGAIDGKHVVIQAPPNTGSVYFNYKKSFSMVLMGVVDAHLRFTIVDIGSYGSESDGGIFGRSDFGQDLVEGRLKLPTPAPLPGTTEEMPYYLVGDEAFPLKENLMRPFPGRGLAADRWNFNKRLSKARRTVENAFGVMAARWRVFRRPIIADDDVTEKMIKATIVLHNFLRTKQLQKHPTEGERQLCVPQDPELVQGDRLLQNLRRTGNNPGGRALAVREKLTAFLHSPQGQLVESV